jgi:pimeloyl-ACP methyl ester carboxylesterase
MKRSEWFRLGLAALLLAPSGWMLWFDGHWRRDTEETEVRAGGCTVPVTVMKGRPGSTVSVVVLHGLGANRRLMYPLSRSLAASDISAVYAIDLPGHGDNTDAFSYSRVESCAAEVIGALEKRGEIRLERTVLLGHSLGGALAMRLADYFPTAATIAVSPAPMVRTGSMPTGVVLPYPPPRRMPNNLLIFTGRFDLPFLNEAARELVKMAGGERQESEDFKQRRAVRWLRLPRATHTSLIYDFDVWRLSDAWWRLALPQGAIHHSFLARSILIFSCLGALGMMLVFPIAASRIARALRSESKESLAAQLPFAVTSLRWVVAGLFAVSVLKFGVPLKFLKMYNGDYLASCLLVVGIVLCALAWKERVKPRSIGAAALTWRAGAVMGLGTMLAFGAWMNWTLTDVWLNASRWLRFPAVTLACVPYALAEEWALGGVAQEWTAGAWRWARFVGLRGIVYLCMLLALSFLASGQILVAVMLPYMGIFSILTRLGANAVRRRTGAVEGAALFTAILTAWFIAAVFPIL